MANSSGYSAPGWIFQGSPDRYNIDGYLAQYPNYVYWRAPAYRKQIRLGDYAAIWRSGPQAGVVAIGEIAELPCLFDKLKFPDALGNEFWASERTDTDTAQVGIRLNEVRLTPEEGMITRQSLKGHPEFVGSVLIKMPNRTVFKVQTNQIALLNDWWGRDSLSGSGGFAATEGQVRLYYHRKRERSRHLRNQKINEALRQNGALACEVCGANGAQYPEHLARRTFEVHHVAPLAAAATQAQTKLTDLAVLCASCHRAVHASEDVEANYACLTKHFDRRG